MTFLIDRVKRLEKRILTAPNDGVLWVKELTKGSYQIEKPRAWEEPDSVYRVPEEDFGRVVDDAYLEKYCVVMIEATSGLIMRVYHD